MKHTPHSSIQPNWAELIQSAHHSRQNAYAPYSGFKVGAAILLSDGTVFTGCNVENISNGATVCAERAALHTAVCANGGDQVEIIAIAVITPTDEPTFPCGLCLQTLGEFVRNPDLVPVRGYAKDQITFHEVKFLDLAPKLFTRFNSQKYVTTQP